MAFSVKIHMLEYIGKNCHKLVIKGMNSRKVLYRTPRRLKKLELAQLVRRADRDC